MASISSSSPKTTTTMHQNPTPYGSDPTSSNTTFVQADPSTFRTIVQQLTGAPDDPSTQKLPVTHPNRPATATTTKKPAFKLHERRQSACKNLHINLHATGGGGGSSCNYPAAAADHHHLFQLRQRTTTGGGGGGGFLVSPVSPLDIFAARVSSPRSPCEEEEERAIAEKGFYLHPSPLSTPRGADPPELLPLFPLRSPRHNEEEAA
ncbi:hypothetical protein Tsubulata_014494 [Turnera subulata]|uniref:VQ domain-containing protein n=1 Tax=Turnera subulata TaxID=218843 RepID=A0A9Q0JT21_9ROSI|nr:hypothetical protein Tsubulata_014494 [Turnera subulata]